MSKWTAANIPDLTGRIAVITGANTGLGFETASAIAARGAHVVMAVRNLNKGREAAALIAARTPGASIVVQELDLASLASVRNAAEQLRFSYEKIDLLINNAGVSQKNAITADGIELHLGTNHIGHFALTGLLLDRLLVVPGSRVVSVSSTTHRIRVPVDFDDREWERKHGAIPAYGRSKLANLLFIYELQRRLIGTHTIAVAAHPGGSATELMRSTPAIVQAIAEALLQSPSMGALPTLRAATDPGVLGGQYYGPAGFYEIRGYPKLVTSSDQSYDYELQRRLWSISEELSGVMFRIQ